MSPDSNRPIALNRLLGAFACGLSGAVVGLLSMLVVAYSGGSAGAWTWMGTGAAIGVAIGLLFPRIGEVLGDILWYVHP